MLFFHKLNSQPKEYFESLLILSINSCKMSRYYFCFNLKLCISVINQKCKLEECPRSVPCYYLQQTSLEHLDKTCLSPFFGKCTRVSPSRYGERILRSSRQCCSTGRCLHRLKTSLFREEEREIGEGGGNTRFPCLWVYNCPCDDLA